MLDVAYPFHVAYWVLLVTSWVWHVACGMWHVACGIRELHLTHLKYIGYHTRHKRVSHMLGIRLKCADHLLMQAAHQSELHQALAAQNTGLTQEVEMPKSQLAIRCTIRVDDSADVKTCATSHHMAGRFPQVHFSSAFS
jgi:hypothetical protein